MPTILENPEKLGLPKVEPLAIPASVKLVAQRLGLSLVLTCRAAPEQYEITKDGQPAGYIRVRHCGMQVSYPDADGEDLWDGAVDGFAGFTDHEREAKMLFALGLIAARMMRG